MELPIQSLYNIFNHSNRILNDHNSAYKLIKDHFQKTNNLNIFILLTTLDGTFLTQENFIESIQSSNLHGGFMPKFDFSLFTSIDRYNRIIDILLCSNEFNSQSCFSDIRNALIEVRQKTDDIETVKSLTNQKITIYNGLTFLINETNFTAKVVHSKKVKGNVIIPRSVISDSCEFIVTSIGKNCFDRNIIKSINFPEDSEVECFEKNSFHCFSLNQLNFPPKLKELQIGWCEGMPKFVDITISRNNPNYQWHNDDFILGKLEGGDEFNVIRYAKISLQRVSIPSFVKRIDQFAFSNYRTNCPIDFAPNSQLEKICDFAFLCSFIREIEIPSHVKEIGVGSFLNSSLSKVTFAENSELEIIHKNAFKNTIIEMITIPAKVKIIGEDAFANCSNLKIVNFADNIELCILEDGCFSKTKIEQIIIPSHVSEIRKRCFYHCTQLKQVQFPLNSSLKLIDNLSFSETGIERISIPSSVTVIGDVAFGYCNKLQVVEIPENSELVSIGSESFYNTKINMLYIPSKAKKINKNWYIRLSSNSIINLSPNNPYFNLFNDQIILCKSDDDIDTFDVVLYAHKNIERTKIPSFIRCIGPHSFESSETLHFIEFEHNSILEIICDYSFYCSLLREISIPSHVKKIGAYSFGYCKELVTINISNDLDLEIIEKGAFSDTKIESILIPSKVKIIGKNAFENCTNLRIVNFVNNCELQIIEEYAFYNSGIEQIIIPQKVVEIRNDSFRNCHHLRQVQFQNNSSLRLIGDNAFSWTELVNISIPVNVIYIGSRAFSFCESLRIVEIPENSELRSLEAETFYDTNLERLFITSKIEVLKEEWCSSLPQNIVIDISPNNHNFTWFNNEFIIGKYEGGEDFNVIVYARSNLVNATIPSFIRRIDNYSFSACLNLRSIRLESGSKLKSVNGKAFDSSVLNNLRYPHELSLI